MGAPSLVLLGASGFLGRNLLRAARDLDLTAVSRHPEAHRELGGVPWIATDALASHLATHRPTAVLNAQGLADLRRCEEDPAEAFRVNGAEVEALGRLCRDHGVPLVHISTDGLFPNGQAGAPRRWAVSDPADPVSAYGRSKLAGERALADLGWGHVVRLSFVGASCGTGRGLLAFLARSLRSGAEIPGYADVWFSPAPAQGAAARLLALAQRAGGGFSLHHWGCDTPLTKFDFLQRVAQAAGFAPRMVPIALSGGSEPLRVPLDQSLACEDPWPLEALLAQSVQALREELG